MKCPNCNIENLPTSSFCVQCGKMLRSATKGSEAAPEKSGKETSTAPSSPAPLAVKPAVQKKKPKTQTPSPSPPSAPPPSAKSAAPVEKTPLPPSPPSEPPIEKVVKIKAKPAGQPPPPQKPAIKNNGQIKVKVNVKKRFLPLLAVLFLFVCALLVWQLLLVNKPQSKAEPVLVPLGDPSIGILYFSNKTGDSSLNIWEKGIAHGLIIKLEQSRRIKILAADRLNQMWDRLKLPKPDDIKQRDFLRMASLAGINHVLRGDFSHNGSAILINAELINISREGSILSVQTDGEGETSILDQLDEIGEKLRSVFTETENFSNGEDHRLSAISTTSVEAFKHYIRGRQLFFVNNMKSSLAALEQAIRVDPDFTLALSAQAAAYTALEYWDKARKLSQIVQSKIAGISERYRYRMQGDFYRRSEKTYDIAFSIYQRLLELYPEDRIAMNNLGWLYYDIRDWQKAEQYFKKNQNGKLNSWENTQGLCLTYIAQKKYSDADKVVNTFIRSASRTEETTVLQANLKLLQEDIKAAKDKAQTFASAAVGFKLVRLRGELAQLEDQHLAAEAAFTELLESDEPIARLWGHYRLAYLYAYEGRFNESRDRLIAGIDLAKSLGEQGWEYRFLLGLTNRYLQDRQPESALQETDKAWEIAVRGETADFPRQVLLYRGLALISLDRLDDARKVADELEILCKKGPDENRMRFFYRLAGEILLAENNYSQAVNNFTKAIELLPEEGMPWLQQNDHAAFYYSLAIAYYLMGSTVEALATLDTINELTWGRLDQGEIIGLSRYMKGKIYEETGINERAADFFEMFISGWRNADPEIPELGTAYERLGLLSR